MHARPPPPGGPARGVRTGRSRAKAAARICVLQATFEWKKNKNKKHTLTVGCAENSCSVTGLSGRPRRSRVPARAWLRSSATAGAPDVRDGRPAAPQHARVRTLVHTHTRTRTHAHVHTRTHARTHAHSHAHTLTHAAWRRGCQGTLGAGGVARWEGTALHVLLKGSSAFISNQLKIVLLGKMQVWDVFILKNQCFLLSSKLVTSVCPRGRVTSASRHGVPGSELSRAVCGFRSALPGEHGQVPAARHGPGAPTRPGSLALVRALWPPGRAQLPRPVPCSCERSSGTLQRPNAGKAIVTRLRRMTGSLSPQPQVLEKRPQPSPGMRVTPVGGEGAGGFLWP